jgi:hypothetical protein
MQNPACNANIEDQDILLHAGLTQLQAYIHNT